VVAFDPLEQMHAQFFQLVGADARGNRLSCPIQIGLDFGVGHRSHAHPGDLDMREHYLAAARHRNCRVQFVGAAGKRAQLLRGLAVAGRLVEKAIVERQRLIGTDDVSIRRVGRDRNGLLARQKRGDVGGRRKT